jgi:hypothetical protein
MDDVAVGFAFGERVQALAGLLVVGQGPLEDLRQLVRLGHELHIVAAILEQGFRMGRLEIINADLAARYMGSDRQHRHAAAMTIE